MIGWLIRHPLHAGIIVGLTVGVLFGILSFPSESEIDKQLQDWLPENASSSQAEIDSLIAALESARSGDAQLEHVSEDDFRGLDLTRSYAFPEAGSDGAFRIDYVGQRESDETVYVAEVDVYPAPWWHPDRLLYRALSYHVDRFSQGLSLTYERDWEGLGAVLIMDLVVGVIYGGIVALLLSVLGTKELRVPAASRISDLPPEASPVPFAASPLGRPPGTAPEEQRRLPVMR